MNDLRSRNRTLAPVRELGPRTGEIVSAPPATRSRSGVNPLFQASRPLDKPSTAPPDGALPLAGEPSIGDDDPLTFPVSRQLQTMPLTVGDDAPASDAGDDAEAVDSTAGDGGTSRRGRRADSGPASRPTKRRNVVDEETVEEDKFPWHYQFDHDEPRELQAKSRLLSRAFRSSVG
ncbi:MAG: hypothetical protein ACFCVK_00040 [Acidimicrobiales bacterium]